MIKTYRLAGLCLFLCFIHPQVFAVHNGLLGTLPVTISSPDSPIVVAPGGTITFTMTAHPSLPGRLLPLGFKVGLPQQFLAWWVALVQRHQEEASPAQAYHPHALVL